MRPDLEIVRFAKSVGMSPVANMVNMQPSLGAAKVILAIVVEDVYKLPTTGRGWNDMVKSLGEIQAPDDLLILNNCEGEAIAYELGREHIISQMWEQCVHMARMRVAVRRVPDAKSDYR